MIDENNPWRQGARVPQNVYFRDEIAGQFQRSSWAEEAVLALNAVHGLAPQEMIVDREKMAVLVAMLERAFNPVAAATLPKLHDDAKNAIAQVAQAAWESGYNSARAGSDQRPPFPTKKWAAQQLADAFLAKFCAPAEPSVPVAGDKAIISEWPGAAFTPDERGAMAAWAATFNIRGDLVDRWAKCSPAVRGAWVTGVKHAHTLHGQIDASVPDEPVAESARESDIRVFEKVFEHLSENASRAATTHETLQATLASQRDTIRAHEESLNIAHETLARQAERVAELEAQLRAHEEDERSARFDAAMAEMARPDFRQTIRALVEGILYDCGAGSAPGSWLGRYGETEQARRLGLCRTRLLKWRAEEK